MEIVSHLKNFVYRCKPINYKSYKLNYIKYENNIKYEIKNTLPMILYSYGHQYKRFNYLKHHGKLQTLINQLSCFLLKGSRYVSLVEIVDYYHRTLNCDIMQILRWIYELSNDKNISTGMLTGRIEVSKLIHLLHDNKQ